MRMYQNFERENKGEYRDNYRNKNYKEKEVGLGLGKGHFQ